MKYVTASEARQISNDANKYKDVGSSLPLVLEGIKAEAERGNNVYVSEGWGPAVPFNALLAALQQLGYTVHNISGTATPGGGKFMERSLKVSW